MNYVRNKLCHEWIRVIYTQESSSLDPVWRRMRTQWCMNDVTEKFCHEWIMSRMNQSRMNTYHIYAEIEKARPGGTAHQDSIMNESCHQWIMSRMNCITNEYVSSIRKNYQVSTRRNGASGLDHEWILLRRDNITNESCHEWINFERIMARMYYVTNELCHEWIRIIHTQELWNLDPAEQHKRTRLRLKQPYWGKIRWSRFYSYGCIHTCVYIHACVCIHVEDRTGCIFMAVYIHVYTYMCIHTRMCMHTCWGSSRWYTYESMNIIV